MKKLDISTFKAQVAAGPPADAESTTVDKQTAMRPDNFYADGKPISGPDTITRVLQEGDTCFLAFSAGKDSLCAWVVLREHFKTIIPFYMFRVPELPYIENILDHYEQVFGTRIYRIPNPDVYHYLAKLMWQAPENCAVIEAAEIADNIGYDVIVQALKLDLGYPPDTFIATGVRAVDNIERGMAVRKHGPINWLRRQFWPVWDKKKAETFETLKASGIRLSCEYFWYGHSIGGTDYRYLSGIYRNSAEDWAVVKQWFPLAHLELARYERIGNWMPNEAGDWYVETNPQHYT